MLPYFGLPAVPPTLPEGGARWLDGGAALALAVHEAHTLATVEVERIGILAAGELEAVARALDQVRVAPTAGGDELVAPRSDLIMEAAEEAAVAARLHEAQLAELRLAGAAAATGAMVARMEATMAGETARAGCGALGSGPSIKDEGGAATHICTPSRAAADRVARTARLRRALRLWRLKSSRQAVLADAAHHVACDFVSAFLRRWLAQARAREREERRREQSARLARLQALRRWRRAVATRAPTRSALLRISHGLRRWRHAARLGMERLADSDRCGRIVTAHMLRRWRRVAFQRGRDASEGEHGRRLVARGAMRRWRRGAARRHRTASMLGAGWRHAAHRGFRHWRDRAVQLTEGFGRRVAQRELGCGCTLRLAHRQWRSVWPAYLRRRSVGLARVDFSFRAVRRALGVRMLWRGLLAFLTVRLHGLRWLTVPGPPPSATRATAATHTASLTAQLAVTHAHAPITGAPAQPLCSLESADIEVSLASDAERLAVDLAAARRHLELLGARLASSHEQGKHVRAARALANASGAAIRPGLGGLVVPEPWPAVTPAPAWTTVECTTFAQAASPSGAAGRVMTAAGQHPLPKAARVPATAGRPHLPMILVHVATESEPAAARLLATPGHAGRFSW